MSDITRRSLLGGVAGVTGLVTVPTAFARSRPALHIYDSRITGALPSARATHDIAHEDATLWRASRDLALAPGDRVTGVTRWIDYVALCGLLGERGLRTRSVTLASSIATWDMD